MDAALLEGRKAFLKKAAAVPSVSRLAEKRSASQDTDDVTASTSKKTAKIKRNKTSVASVRANLSGSVSGLTSTSNIVGYLVKIIDFMKRRYIERQQNFGLSLDEILEELNVLDMPLKIKNALLENLPNNPRLSTTDEGKFAYNPPHKVKGKNSLLNVLKRYDLEGKGGLLLSELEDCVPHPAKLVEALGDSVMSVTTSKKSTVLFYNDPEASVQIDDEFKALWRSVGVDHLDEKKIEEYLHKHGIHSMKDLAPKKANAIPKRKDRKKKPAIVHNEYLAKQGVLQDYSVE